MRDFGKIFVLALIFGALGAADSAYGRLNVVASTPNYGAIAEAVGGERVQVRTLARGGEDPHFVTPRPSFIPILNRADVLIESGAELEIGWLPPLVQSARNHKIISGADGHIELARSIDLLDVPTGRVDRRSGDIHLAGNPHFLLDPLNGGIAAEAIVETFVKLDPEGEEIYRENLRSFLATLEEKMQGWKEALADYDGTEIVTYHKNFNYFARRFGIEIVGEVEPLAGVEPSPRHIASLISRMRSREVPMLWIESHRPRRTPVRVADQTGAVLVTLPEQVGGVKEADDYFALIDFIVTQIVEAGS